MLKDWDLQGHGGGSGVLPTSLLVIDIGSADTHVTRIGYTMNPAISNTAYLPSSGGERLVEWLRNVE